MKKSNLVTVIICIAFSVLSFSCSDDDDNCPEGIVDIPSSLVRTYEGQFSGLLEEPVSDGTATITRTDCGLYTVSFSNDEIDPYTDISFLPNAEGTVFTNVALFPVIVLNDEGLTVSDLSPTFTFNTEEE